MNKKAQILSMDLFISMIFFIAVFALWLLISNALINQAVDAQEIGMLDKKLQRVSDLLIRTEGLPPDWNESTVQSIGLAESEYIVNYSKVMKFSNMNPTNRARLLGLQPYKVYFRIANLTGGNFTNCFGEEEEIKGGSLPTTDYNMVLSTNRFFVMNFGCRREIGQLQLSVWR